MTAIFVDQAIDQLQVNFRGAIIEPTDADYDEARSVRNGLIDRYPALIARCSGTADVVAAVNFARDTELLLSVRGGGHNVSGAATNDGGIVIDLSPMRGVRVDPEARTVRVQGGATWGDVDCETQLFGLATPGGNVSTTGVGGLTLHGGWGWLRRKYGYCVDLVRHFVDPSLAVAALGASPDRLLRELEWLGLLFESLVVRDLRVYTQSHGGRLTQYRDNKGAEVDAIVEAADGRWGAFEIKLGAGRVDEGADSLKRFERKIDVARSGEPAFLGVIVGSGYGYVRPDGVHVIPIGALGP